MAQNSFLFSDQNLDRSEVGSSLALELLQHFAASQQPLRTVSWLPAEMAPADATFDQTHRHVFIAAGHSGYLQLWDAR